MAMYAVVVKGGKFTFTVDRDLSRGLRSSLRNPRNEEYLITCDGAVGRDGVLAAIEQFTRMDTSSITDAFPFPQVFVFSHLVIVCGAKKIYEWDGSSLTLVYTAAAAGGTWDMVDFHSYIYASNGRVAVERSGADGSWALSTLPSAVAMCNYNGQVLIGGPDTDGVGTSLMIVADPLTLTMTNLGTFSIGI